jgi:hypothetical protein
MRRLISLTVLAIALAVPAVGYAVVGGGSDDGTLSVKSGAGRVYININGTVIGRLGKGYIQITDPNPNDGQGFDFIGCDPGSYDKSISTSVCHSDGKDGVVRFKAIGGNYRITIYKASAIFLSAVGHGWGTLNGAGDDPTIPGNFDGTYSLNDGPYKSLPDELHSFALASPAGG